MRSFPFIFFLFIAHPIMVLSQTSQWQLVAPIPPRIPAYSSVTIGHKAYFWSANNLVFSSSDGGQSFIVHPSYGPVKDVALGCCSNQGIAFADTLVGYVADLAHGEFRTTDGGLTWQQVASPGSNIQLVAFATNEIGWKFGDGGTYKTTDGGESWTFISTPYAFGGTWGKAFALDETRVWLAKSYHPGRPTEGSIWHSSNGGISWRQQPAAPTSDTNQYVIYTDLKITSSGLGVAIGTIESLAGTKTAFASRTTNFGLAWTTTTFANESPRTLLAIGDTVWIILGGGSAPYLRRSADSAKTWTYQDNIFPNASYQQYGTATFVPSFSTILASTLNGVYKSTDFGLTFSKVTNPFDFPVTNITMDRRENSPQQLVMATSYDGKFINTTDAGNNWKHGTLPSPSFDPRITISHGTIYFPLGHQLRKSTDRGDSWIASAMPVASGIRAFDAYDANNLAFQSHKAIWRSTDAGTSWERTPYSESSYLNVSQITQPGTIIAAGAYYDTTGTRGAIFRTSDWGFNWRIIDLPREINRLVMITPNTGFALSDYEVHKTTDAGKNWQTILSSQNFFTHYVDFFFKDSTNLTLRVSFEFWESTNGGSSWTTKELVLPVYQLSEIVRTNDGNVFAVGDGMLWKLATNEIPTQEHAADTVFTQAPQTDPFLKVFPNPFNPTTVISFFLPQPDYIQLEVYDMLGRRVSHLLSGETDQGTHQVTFDGSSLASGMYVLSLRGTLVSKATKILLLR